jgi:hypothetical protein
MPINIRCGFHVCLAAVQVSVDNYTEWIQLVAQVTIHGL